MKQEITNETMKSAPPIAITVASTIGGLSLNEWMAIATITYIALQTGYLIWKWVKEYRIGKARNKRHDDE